MYLLASSQLEQLNIEVCAEYHFVFFKQKGNYGSASLILVLLVM
jgi:hypothetical protein